MKPEKRAVLVIDNDPYGAETLKCHLVDGGYRVYTTGSLDETLKIAEEKKVAVAVLALGRPGLDSGRLIKNLQAVRGVGSIPVIVILEKFAEDLVAGALKTGAADYLIRPVDSKELVSRVGVYARLKEDKQAMAESTRPKGLFARLLPRLTGDFGSLFSASEVLDQRYEKMDRLGIGSFGEVWKVRNVRKDPPEVFVAKIPLSKKLNAKIEKEARILERLAGHVIVPEVCEVIQEKGKKVLILEFVEGKTLFEVIERELEEKEVESVMIQLMNGVAYAHDMGIIHRDIKPGNVMVRPDGTLKLLDFGAAKELKEREMSDTVTGSRPYMSPEQIMGKSQRRSDVWALGVVMYVLYTGLFPFYHDVEKVLMDMILELPPPPPSKSNEDIDPEIEKVILRCLEKNLKNRYPDAGVLREAITAISPGYGKSILPLY
ncbi:protein kinase [Thermodesulfobacteriota bacterium]